MFTTKEDFDRIPYMIPAKQLCGTSETGQALTELSQTFIDYAEKKEADILEKLLGLRVYNEFTEDLLNDYPEQKWVLLRDGSTYENGSALCKWVGLRTMLTPYVFSMWLRDNYDSYNDTGVSTFKVENAEKISPALRIVQAWNEFYGIAGMKKTSNRYSSGFDIQNTLYGFMYVNKAISYPDWVYQDVGGMNRFNL